jgi:hypothetical protein
MERIVKLPLIVGAGIVVLVLAAFLLAPHLRSGEAKTAEQARNEAALAQRALYQYDYQLPDVQRLAPPEELKKADLNALAEAAKSDIDQARTDLGKRLKDIRSQAAQAGLPPPQGELPSADAGGLKRALAHYEKMLADNEQLLKQAVQQARSAKSAGASVLGVPQVAGMVEYTRASRALTDARALRAEQQRLQAELLRADAQARDYEASQGYAAGLELNTVGAALRNDLAEIQKLAAEAAQQAEKLAAQVAQREQELAPIEAEQAQVRDELLALESQGFKPGNDASFEGYRAQYQRLSERARILQEHEELLRYGGLRGAEFASDDYENAEIRGGEAVTSLEILREVAAAAKERVTRSAQALTELEEQIKTTEKSGQDAQALTAQYGELAAERQARRAELLPRVTELAKKASEKEDEALKAAGEAVSAFRTSQQAADGWVRAARELQSERDPERSNPRLKMILDDKAVPVMGSSAEAGALVLIGRVYAQRIEANRALMTDLEQARSADEQGQSVTEDLEAQIGKDVGEATAKLQNAIKIYDGLVSKVKPETKWVPQAALAGVHALLARIDPSQAAAHLSDALAQAQASTGGRERFPYLQQHVEFEQHLKHKLETADKSGAGSGPAAEGEQAPEGEKAGGGG